MKYYEEEHGKTDGTPCSGLKADLKRCILESDCVKKFGKSAKECLKTLDPHVPDECYALRRSFFECKRSLLDNRQRFRGKKGY